MKGLNGKKGLILVALLMASLLGAYAAQYYIWNVTYTIKPLTTNIGVTIPATQGATRGYWGTTTLVTVTKASVVFFMVTDSDTEKLEGDFYEMIVRIKAGGKTCTLILIYWGFDEFHEDNLPVISGIPLEPGTYTVDVTIDYWTGALVSEVSHSFTINVFAHEIINSDLTCIKDTEYNRYYPDGGHDGPSMMSNNYIEHYVQLAGGWFYQPEMIYIPGVEDLISQSIIITPDGNMQTTTIYTYAGHRVKNEFTGTDHYVYPGTAHEIRGNYTQYCYEKAIDATQTRTYPAHTPTLVGGTTDVWYLFWTDYTCHPTTKYP